MDFNQKLSLLKETFMKDTTDDIDMVIICFLPVIMSPVIVSINISS